MSALKKGIINSKGVEKETFKDKANRIIFYLFTGIFAITAIVTLLGITKVVNIAPEFLGKLFYTLIVAVATSIINYFALQFLKKEKRVTKKEGKIEKIKFKFDIGDIYDKYKVDKFVCTAKLRNTVDGKETPLKCSLFHDELIGLCSYVKITNYKQTFFVILDID